MGLTAAQRKGLGAVGTAAAGVAAKLSDDMEWGWLGYAPSLVVGVWGLWMLFVDPVKFRGRRVRFAQRTVANLRLDLLRIKGTAESAHAEAKRRARRKPFDDKGILESFRQSLVDAPLRHKEWQERTARCLGRMLVGGTADELPVYPYSSDAVPGIEHDLTRTQWLAVLDAQLAYLATLRERVTDERLLRAEFHERNETVPAAA